RYAGKSRSTVWCAG
ncbi:hypothetical protein ECEC1735_1976, partial [Escherichia coli EC1735]